MREQSSKKPAPAVTGNRLQKADRLGGAIYTKNSKLRTRGQTRQPNSAKRPAARHQRRYPFANIDCRFDKRTLYAVKLFFSRRDYLVWGPYSNVRDAIRQREHLQQRFGRVAEWGQR
jgi:hypothetical protein